MKKICKSLIVIFTVYQCSTADPAAISKIMSKFGKIKG